MNSQIFTPAKHFTSLILLIASLAASAEEWKVDLSRRTKAETPKEMNADVAVDGTAVQPANKNFFSSLFDSSEPLQEVVILNTDRGFVPSTVRVRQGGTYRVHVVNVNERDKNVSFVLDAFSEHHATYFGKIKTFDMTPKRTGVFRFVSPETSAQGRVVVYPAADAASPGSPQVRAPAAEEP